MHCGVFLQNGKTVAQFPKEWKALQVSFRNPVFWKPSEGELFDCVVLEGETQNSTAIRKFYEGHKVPIYWRMEDGTVDFGNLMPRIMSKSFKGLQEGMWDGLEAVIIGGGPSVKDMPQSFLEGKKVIGINRAFEFFRCDIAFGTDRRWLTWIEGGNYGDEARERWRVFKGKKVILRGSKYPVKDEKMVVFNPYASAVKFSPSLEEGLTRSSNSGIPAINLAILLGASKIYLAGFDCTKTENGLQTHFHSGHPETQKDSIFEGFIKSFKLFAPQVPENVQVLNMNPNSGIKDFPFYTDHLEVKPLERVVNPPSSRIPQQKVSPSLFVTAYTPDYSTLAASLQDDLEKYKLEYEMIPIEDTGKWAENCNLKPFVLKCLREEYPDSILVWIDADARIEKDPVLFSELNGADIALHKLDNRIICSGTLAFLPTENGNRLLSAWSEMCEKNQTIMDQVSLAKCIEALNPKVHLLPESYCRIFDRKNECKDPVIVHYQESRNRRKREKAQK